MKKLIIALAMVLALSMPVMAGDTGKVFNIGINDGSIDTIYLFRSDKFIGGMGFSPITFFDDAIGVRVEYANELRGEFFQNDMLGLMVQGNVTKIVNLIPHAKWQLPDIGVKFGIGYMADIENLKEGEPAIIISVVKIF